MIDHNDYDFFPLNFGEFEIPLFLGNFCLPMLLLEQNIKIPFRNMIEILLEKKVDMYQSQFELLQHQSMIYGVPFAIRSWMLEGDMRNLA